jgi:hypothetical protein
MKTAAPSCGFSLSAPARRFSGIFGFALKEYEIRVAGKLTKYVQHRGRAAL